MLSSILILTGFTAAHSSVVSSDGIMTATRSSATALAQTTAQMNRVNVNDNSYFAKHPNVKAALQSSICVLIAVVLVVGIIYLSHANAPEKPEKTEKSDSGITSSHDEGANVDTTGNAMQLIIEDKLDEDRYKANGQYRELDSSSKNLAENTGSGPSGLVIGLIVLCVVLMVFVGVFACLAKKQGN